MRTSSKVPFSKTAQGGMSKGGVGSLQESEVPVLVETCSVFAPGVEVVGTLHAPGAVFLEGRFDGDLTSKHLTIGRGGSFSGKVQSEVVETRGSLHGDVSCRSFVGFDEASVEGVVRCSSIELQKGISIKADLLTS